MAAPSNDVSAWITVAPTSTTGVVTISIRMIETIATAPRSSMMKNAKALAPAVSTPPNSSTIERLDRAVVPIASPRATACWRSASTTPDDERVMSGLMMAYREAYAP